MRFLRVKADGQGFDHCVSRVVDRQFIFQTSGHGSLSQSRLVSLFLLSGLSLQILHCVWPADASDEYCEVLEGFGRERAKDGSHWSWRGWQYAIAWEMV